MRRVVALLVAGCIALTAGAVAAAERVRDDRGIELTFHAPPQRIVTLLPSLTETVCAVGGCARLVGTDRYSDWPAEVVALPKLGGIDDALVERIVALKPDLVLAARSTRAVDRLESLGLRVLAFESDTHAQVQRSLLAVARLLDQPAAGEAAWKAIQEQLAQAAARVPPGLRGKSIYFEVDSTPYAAGAASFVGETLARLALRNIAPASMGPFPKLNPEFVVRAQPFIIVAGTRNAAEMPRRPGWAALQALQQRRVCALDSTRYLLLTRPGPRLGQAALALADCLNTMAAASAAPSPAAPPAPSGAAR